MEKKNYRTDVFYTDRKGDNNHQVAYFWNRDIATAYLDSCRCRGAVAGFLLTYSRTGSDGQDYYDVEELVY